jgi:tRNA-splicing ligase RtcB
MAVMPDVHLAEGVCIGTVVATQRHVYPAAVGSDIGCGMAVLPMDADAGLLADPLAAAKVLKGLAAAVPSIRHPKATMPESLPRDLVEKLLSSSVLENNKRRDGRVQCGTLGRGNHFLEVQADESDRLWIMVHSGSRGMGQVIFNSHVKGRRRGDRPLSLFALDSQTPEGQAYLQDVEWAVDYARSNRRAMLHAVVSLFEQLFDVKANWSELIDADHNHVRRETHDETEMWVHRKGAQSARVGEWAIIPGSMGAESFLVTGRGLAASLFSCSHGAGRQLSRTEARRKVSPRKLETEMGDVWFDHRRCRELCDEAPSVYKDIRRVMRAQRDLVKIERRLRPLLNYKG